MEHGGFVGCRRKDQASAEGDGASDEACIELPSTLLVRYDVPDGRWKHGLGRKVEVRRRGAPEGVPEPGHTEIRVWKPRDDDVASVFGQGGVRQVGEQPLSGVGLEQAAAVSPARKDEAGRLATSADQFLRNRQGYLVRQIRCGEGIGNDGGCWLDLAEVCSHAELQRKIEGPNADHGDGFAHQSFDGTFGVVCGVIGGMDGRSVTVKGDEGEIRVDFILKGVPNDSSQDKGFVQALR